MKRLGVAGLISIFALYLIMSPTLAGLQWCPRDPIVSLNGHEVQIWVSIPEEYQAAVTGPVEVLVAVPKGVHSEVVFTDEGFNGHGETVEFRERGKIRSGMMKVDVKVRVPYDQSLVEGGNLPIRLQIVLPDGEVIEVEDHDGKAKAEFSIPAIP